MIKNAKFKGLDSARMNRLYKREEIRTKGIFEKTSEIDEKVKDLKKKLGLMPSETRKALKIQMKSNKLL